MASQIFADEDVHIDEFALGLSRVVAAEPDLAAFQIALDLHGRLDPELRSDSKRHWERYLAATEAALERVGTAADPAITHMVLATLTGLVLTQLSFSSPAETDRAVRALQGRSRSCASGPTIPRPRRNGRDRSLPPLRGASSTSGSFEIHPSRGSRRSVAIRRSGR